MASAQAISWGLCDASCSAGADTCAVTNSGVGPGVIACIVSVGAGGGADAGSSLWRLGFCFAVTDAVEVGTDGGDASRLGLRLEWLFDAAVKRIVPSLQQETALE